MSSSAIVNSPAGFANTFAHWQPEDLVHLLATLDDETSHAMLPYVLPQSSLIGQFKPPIDLIGQSDDQTLANRLYADRQIRDMIGEADDADKPLLANSGEPENVIANPVCEIIRELSYEETASSTSAVQTPCSTEEKSIIKTSSKPTLKRVSFGSSKGSMVETLVYESPIVEDEPSPFGVHVNRSRTGRTSGRTAAFKIGISSTPLIEEAALHTFTTEEITARPASKVRVTFYESERPLTLSSPEPSEISDWEAATYVMAHDTSATTPTQLTRQMSTESGQDNPFRPDGDLSREADEIVELIKGGRPISEALKPRDDHRAQGHDSLTTDEADAPAVTERLIGSSTSTNQDASPVKAAGNGSAAPELKAEPETLTTVPLDTVQHALVATPTEPGKVEHVVIKKKGNCKCCVIQ